MKKPYSIPIAVVQTFEVTDLFGRKNLLAVYFFLSLHFSHPLRCVVYAVVILEVTKKCDAIIDIVHDYQVSSAIAAFNDVFTRTGSRHH